MSKQPAVPPGSGDRPPLAQVELGDVVRLRKPYRPRPRSGLPEAGGPYTMGIVAEILSVLPDGRTRNVSLHLYCPLQRELYVGPNGIPQFVDFHCSELELYKRAADPGYSPVVS